MIRLLTDPNFLPNNGTELGNAIVNLPRNHPCHALVITCVIAFAFFQPAGAALAALYACSLAIGFTLSNMALADREIAILRPFRGDSPDRAIFGWATLLGYVYQPIGIAAYALYMTFYGRDIYQLPADQVLAARA